MITYLRGNLGYIAFYLFLILLVPYPAYPEVVRLKSGKVIKGDILGITDNYIKMEFKGLSLFYYLTAIKSINAEPPEIYLAKMKISSTQDFSFYFDKGLNYAVAARFSEAREAFKKSSDIGLFKEPSEASLQILEDLRKGVLTEQYALNLFKGIHCRISGEDKQAIMYYQKAIEIDPAYAEPYRDIGNVYAPQEKYRQAIDYYLEYLKINPADADVCYNLGICFLGQGKSGEASQYFRRAIEIEPNDTELYNNLGVLYAKLGKFDKTIAYFKAFLAIQPDDAEVCCNLGIAYVGLGQAEEGITYLRKAVNIEPDCAEAYASLGSVYSGLGRYDQARKSFNKARELFKSRADFESVQEVDRFLGQLP